jgi:hypothetical protein
MSLRTNPNPSTKRSLVWMTVVAFLISILAIAAACSDDDDGDDGDDDSGSPTATQPADGNGGDDDGDDGGDDSGNGDGGDTLQDLSDLAANYEGATGVATFTFTTDGEEASWTYYFDGDSSRVDIEADDGAFISISTPDASYLCTESDGEGLCFSGDGSGAFTNPFLPLFDQYASSDAIFTYLDLFTDVDVEKSSEDIAGVDTDCFTASGDFGSESGTIKWCFSETGVLLLSQYDLDGSSFEMRATDFSSEVPGDAFEPPYQVTSFGG